MKKITIKIILILMCTALLFCALSSCTDRRTSNDKIKILCTVFPVYDWARNIVAGSENVEVGLLVENGTDLHSFQPSFGDMAKIKDSDIVIYIGGESDKWVAESIDERALGIELSTLENIRLYAISADSIANKHTHDGEECHEEHSHEHGFDEHLWLSLHNAKVSATEICKRISKLDNSNSQLYQKNTDGYISKLDELDKDMRKLGEIIKEPMIFADRFPFVYLLSDYGIDYFAAFEGCSTDTGADFDTVITLAKKADEYQSRALFITESPVDGLTKAIITQTKSKAAEAVALDSMQSLGKKDIESGKSYISIMKRNINRIQEIYSN